MKILSPEKILIAVAGKSMHTLIESFLESPERRFVFAEDGLTALLIAGEENPDMVILDAQIPGADVNEVCRTLRANENTSRIPILMLSGRGRTGDILDGLMSGADDYLVKPVSAKVLSARVDDLLKTKARLPSRGDSYRALLGSTSFPTRR